jgi:hypothetical protein
VRVLSLFLQDTNPLSYEAPQDLILTSGVSFGITAVSLDPDMTYADLNAEITVGPPSKTSDRFLIYFPSSAVTPMWIQNLGFLILKGQKIFAVSPNVPTFCQLYFEDDQLKIAALGS